MQLLLDLPRPWRYVAFALLGLGLWFVLRWVDQPDESDHEVEIHVKATHLSSFAVPMLHGTWWKLRVPAAQVDAEMAMLAGDPDVTEAYVVPQYSLPSADANADSCPINTPSYNHHQGYLDPAPSGIDAAAMWRANTRGQQVWFADVEGGWNAKHEDLPGDRISHVFGRPVIDASWRAHGTAVLGEIAGRDNDKGVTGIAPDVERIFTSSIGGEDVADALQAAAEALRPGDVMLIELQGTGPRGRFVPVEFWDDNYEAIKAATDRGVIVVEAAGNGNEDLDWSGFKGKFDTQVRDSGAIMVGAGGPPRNGFRDREKLDFSNYGARVDVQGWGRMVATLDYGDLQSCKGADRNYTDRHYTNLFSGTSSASPIVAGAAVLVESYLRTHDKPVMTPHDLRELLRATGTPQAGSTKKQIGPRPDLARVLGLIHPNP
ncbi:MAG: S8 family serine peptidase [Kofleriaceae bacterium]